MATDYDNEEKSVNENNEIHKKSKEAYIHVVKNFKNYEANAKIIIKSKINSFKQIPQVQQNYISSFFNDRIEKSLAALQFNQQFLNAAIDSSSKMFGFEIDSALYNSITSTNKHVHTMLRQAYREWSREAYQERASCYGSIVNTFKEYYSSENIQQLNVIVPGSGLGRLVYELALTGCNCIHNENDMHMLALSYGFMNSYYSKEEFTIYPWVTEWSNNFGSDQILLKATIPDVEIDKNVRMVALAGDFSEIFDSSYDSSIDCIVTCFFIDTSPNVISLIEKIHLLLKPGGTWINFGPLTYHYTDRNFTSIEPTLEEIMHVTLECLNFSLVKEMEIHDCPYFGNPLSMHQYHYKCPKSL